MVVVRIWEGLGNQLFQYAYARALQLRTGKQVCLDTDRIFKDVLEHKGVERKYSLDKFHIQLPIANNTERKLFFLERRNYLHKLVLLLAKNNLWFWAFQKENDIWYKEKQKIVRDNSYLMGWFQDEKYFIEYRDILLKELTPKKKIRISKKLRDMLKSDLTVSVHIRRTDFKKLGNTLPVSYYKLAQKTMESRVANPQYIIFTDDAEWVKAHLDFGENAYWVCEEELKDYEELFVMSRCRHNIIANSTFSWWGAWLNKNENKIVVGPRQWNVIHTPNMIKENIMPESWIRV